MKRDAGGVPRETLAALTDRYALPPEFPERMERLLVALAAEPDPHTTVADPRAAVDVHIADSLAGLEIPELRGASRIADLGAGAGFPGLVLAAALPDAQVDLVESASRKTSLIERLAEAAGIPARALTARAEEWAAGEGASAYDAVTVRAVASLPVLVEYAAPLLASGGALVAWKGSRDASEEAAGASAAAQIGLSSAEIVPVTPYRGSRDRNLHVYLKVRETPSRYPRRPGMATKRPLK